MYIYYVIFFFAIKFTINEIAFFNFVLLRIKRNRNRNKVVLLIVYFHIYIIYIKFSLKSEFLF